MRTMSLTLSCVILLLTSACHTNRESHRVPIVYQGDRYSAPAARLDGGTYRSYPSEQHRYSYGSSAGSLSRDTAECEERASEVLGTSSERHRGRDVLVSGGTGAALGAATGALAGVITKQKVGRATGAGAAIGALLGSARGAMRRDEPESDSYYRYVEECLRDRGHRVVGWEESR
jgi:hypothetical protein